MKKLPALLFACLFLITVQGQNLETVVQRSGGGTCTEFAISSDGLLLAKINDNISVSEVEIWNTKTGHLLRVISTNKTTDGSGFFFNSVKHVRFWKGSKNIITGTNDGRHEIYDVATGKLVKQLKIRSYLDGIFAVCEKTGALAVIPPLSLARSQLYFVDLYSEIIYDSVALELDGGITALEFSPAGDKIAVGTTEGSFHILELAAFNRTLRGDSIYSGDIDYIQWTGDNYLLITGKDKCLIYNLKNNQLILNQKMAANSRMLSSPAEDCYYIAQEHEILKRTGSGVIQKKMGIDPDMVQQMEMDPENKRLYILTDNFIRVWDLKNILQTESKKIETFAPGFLLANQKKERINKFRFIPSLRSCIYQEGDQLIQQPIDTILAGQTFSLGSEKLNSLLIVSSGFPVASLNGTLKIWKAGKDSQLTTTGNDSLLFVFPSADKLAAVSSKDSVLKIYDLHKGNFQKIDFNGSLYCGAFSPNKQQFAVAGDNLYIVNTTTLSRRRLYDSRKEDFVYAYDQQRLSTKIPGNYRQLCFSKNGQQLFAINIFGQVKVWNLKTFTIDTILNINASQVQVTSDGNKILIASQNQLLLMNTNGFKTEAHIAFLAKGDFIVSLADNYYRSSRNGAKAVAFRKGLQSSGFDQFDIIYNRPDIVAQKIGSPAAGILESLQKAVKKRRKKLGFAETNDNYNDLEAPELSVKNYNKIPTTTREQDFNFIVSAKDKKYPLVNYHGFINGVPFSSKNGYDLTASGTAEERKSISLDITAALDPGKNLVEISCTNVKGIESARESFEMFYEVTDPPKPTLYFIGIGAGNYKNSEFNLKYPSKDIADVSKLFQGKNDLYGDVKVTVLTNEQVTKKAITGLKKILSTTNIRDQVIIYWSGHGVLTKELDYYLATYDMDFSNPESDGLEYSDLENLLDGIPARKKLLFIDACHSGELDKEESVLTKDARNAAGATGTKGLHVNVSSTGPINSAALLNELFADTRRNAGENIISAAGGAEYALEGDKWANGVFTYALLSGLTEKKADLNKDGEILISELQTYLQEKVPELTNGRQKPTSRTENLVKDWRIW